MRDRAKVRTIQWGIGPVLIYHLVRSTLSVIPDIHFESVGFSKSMMANRPLLIKLILVNSLASVLPALTKTLNYDSGACQSLHSH
jgi:hypothetical protein